MSELDNINAESLEGIEFSDDAIDSVSAESLYDIQFDNTIDLPEEGPEYLTEFKQDPYGVKLRGKEFEDPDDLKEPSWLKGQRKSRFQKAFAGTDEYIARVDPAVQHYVDDAGLIDAVQTTGSGVANYWEDNNFFWGTLNAFSGVEQGLARTSLALASKFGSIPIEDAKAMMSQQEFHWHDIINYHWRGTDAGEKTAKFAVGLLADVLLDPMTYLTVGIYGAVKAGGAIRNFRKLGAMERLKVRQAHRVEKILSSDGVVHPGVSGEMDKFIKGEHKTIEDAIIDTEILTGVDPVAALNKIDEIKKNPSYIDDLRQGYRQSQFNFRIPGTNIETALDIPGLAKAQIKTADGIAWASGKVSDKYWKLAESIPYMAQTADTLHKIKSGLGTIMTRTGRVEFDSAQQAHSNNRTAIDLHLSQSKEEGYTLLDSLEPDLLDDVLDEAERFIPEERLKTLRSEIEAPLDKKISMQEIKIKKQQKQIDYELDQSKKVYNLHNPDAIIDPFTKKRIIKDGNSPYVEATFMRQEITAGQFLEDYKKSHRYRGSIDDANAEIKDLAHDRYELSKKIDDSPADIARKQRIMNHPQGEQVIQYIQKIRKESDATYRELRKRYPWFEELYPLGHGDDYARGYMKHTVSRDYMKLQRDSLAAADKINAMLAKSGIKIDKGVLGRKNKQTINSLNEAAGAKVFETDPVFLHTYRMKQMTNNINNHDFLQSIAGEISIKPKFGYEPFIKAEDFADLLDKRTFHNPDDLTSYVNYLPKEYRKLIASGKNIYLPRDVVYRVQHLVNPNLNKGIKEMVFGLANNISFMYTKAKLWGTDYLGQNVFGNSITYAYAGGNFKQWGKATSIVDTKLHGFTTASANKLPGKADKAYTFRAGKPDEISFTRDEMYKTLVDNGLLGNVFVESINWELVNSTIGSAAKTGLAKIKIPLEALKTPARNLGEVATLYGLNRNLSRIGDEIPKVALFMDRLEKGYSIAGAAEDSLYWFHDFKNMTRTQRAFSKAVPFSSFALKTMEQTVNTVHAGKSFSHLTMPGKVSAMFNGLFINDPQTEQFLTDILPEYRDMQDKTFGPMMGGGQYIMLDIPWAKSTLPMLFDPSIEANPIYKVLATMGSVAGNALSGSPIEAESDIDRQIHFTLNSFMPPPLAHAFTVGELSGKVDIPFMEYEQHYGERTRTADSGKEYKAALQGSGQLYRDLEKEYGENWAFNMFFHGSIDGPKKANSLIGQLHNEAKYSNFIKKYFRDLSFGAARLESFDKNFIIKYTSVDKRIRELTKDINDIKYKQGPMHTYEEPVDDESQQKRLNSLLALDNLSEIERFEVERLNARIYQKTLFAYYGFMKKVKDESPGLMESIVQGGGKIDYGSVPEYYLKRDQATVEAYTQLDLAIKRKAAEINQEEQAFDIDPADLEGIDFD